MVRQIKLPPKLKPFKGILLFAIILMLSNFFWKYNVTGDEANGLNSTVTFWGFDISAPFIWMARNVAQISEAILHLFGYNVILTNDNHLGFPNGNAVQIIWACTGLKQAYIFACIIAFNRGSWIKKAWFIPLGLFIVYAVNIFRIVCITISVEHHPEWFTFLHLYLFKYLFYLIIFFIWVWWEEKIAGKITIQKKD